MGAVRSTRLVHQDEKPREAKPRPLVLRVYALDTSTCMLVKDSDARFDLSQQWEKIADAAVLRL